MTLKTKVNLSKELLEKYSVSIPRYTSYPTAPEWTSSFTKEDFLLANKSANSKKSPMSLYFHLPFCESRCHFCACNVVISKKRDIVNPYIEHIKKETQALSNLISKDRQVEQIHLGGGTPTYFTPYELTNFFNAVKKYFNISEDCETCVEIDPRVTTYEHLETLSSLGFNRLSMGIQDFDLKIQEATNRVQSYEETRRIFTYARELGFKSINVDLIYGLPYQTSKTFARTIKLVLKLAPDRIALFHFAYLPQLLAHQSKYIPYRALPTSDEKISIFQHAVNAFTDNGFVFIGLDHFAKPGDELALARKNKTLHRNFQGYTTKATCDLYGLGITAISNIQNTFSQNIKKLKPYYGEIKQGKLPLYKGIVLNKDDELRREIIMRILCHGIVDIPEIEEKYDIDFNEYFSYELEQLENFKQDDLILLKLLARQDKSCPYRSVIEVTILGQFFLRNIASVFDLYLRKKDGQQRIYSKSI